MLNTAVNDLIDRLPAGVSLAHLAQVAEMHPNHLVQMKSGKRPATAVAVGRLKLALVRIKSRQLVGGAAHNALFRSLLVIAAIELGVDPAMAQNSDPSKRSTASTEWRSAAFARWIARYLMNTTLGFSMADIGRAEGVTKAAVSASMPEIELKRDDPEFDAVISRLELHLLGGV